MKGPHIDFAGPWTTPEALVLAWNDTVHVVACETGLRLHGEQLLGWWRYFEGADRQFHLIEEVRIGHSSASSKANIWCQESGIRSYLVWETKPDSMDCLAVSETEKLQKTEDLPRTIAFGSAFRLQGLLDSGLVRGHKIPANNEVAESATQDSEGQGDGREVAGTATVPEHNFASGLSPSAPVTSNSHEVADSATSLLAGV